MTWPTKDDFVDGDVLTAAQVNNIANNLNEADPTGITDGYVLTADGAGAMGWEAVAAGGWTLINSGTLSGASITSSTFSGYRAIHIDILDSVTSTTVNTQLRVNGLTTSIYAGTVGYSTTSSAVNFVADLSAATSLKLNGVGQQSSDTATFAVTIYNASETVGQKMVVMNYRLNNTNPSNFNWGNGRINTAAALTSVTLLTNTGTWSSGSYRFYGLK